jgi:hypothetical protein
MENGMSSQERQELQEWIAKDLSDANLWTKLWSAVHHTFLFGGAILSALAALVLQLDIATSQASATNIATLVAGAAALTSTIAVSGGFARKWRTNRLIKVQLTKLKIELINPDADTASIRKTLKDIAQLRYDGIIGEDHNDRNSS